MNTPKVNEIKIQIIRQARFIILILEKQNQIENQEYRLKSMKGGTNNCTW